MRQRIEYSGEKARWKYILRPKHNSSHPRNQLSKQYPLNLIIQQKLKFQSEHIHADKEWKLADDSHESEEDTDDTKGKGGRC